VQAPTLSSDGGPITVVVVTYESSAVIAECLASLGGAAPRRGVTACVVDNASTDGSADLAARATGAPRVIRMERNGGFAAGVNAGLRAATTRWIAVLNPDTVVPPGALDRLADVLERHPRAALVGPRVRDAARRAEATVGYLPTVARERAHAYLLDKALGLQGRRARFPARTRGVEWVSGCAWLLRAEAVQAVGLLDEGYFMYYEDVDYCRRLRDAGWQVLATPEVEIYHGVGHGSRVTRSLPVDGGAALLRYFSKFHPGPAERRARRVLERGWRLRRAWRRALARLGDADSAAIAERFDAALRLLPRE
jgi:GT2 family glycosyltransferase